MGAWEKRYRTLLLCCVIAAAVGRQSERSSASTALDLDEGTEIDLFSSNFVSDSARFLDEFEKNSSIGFSDTTDSVKKENPISKASLASHSKNHKEDRNDPDHPSLELRFQRAGESEKHLGSLDKGEGGGNLSSNSINSKGNSSSSNVVQNANDALKLDTGKAKSANSTFTSVQKKKSEGNSKGEEKDDVLSISEEDMKRAHDALLQTQRILQSARARMKKKKTTNPSANRLQQPDPRADRGVRDNDKQEQARGLKGGRHPNEEEKVKHLVRKLEAKLAGMMKQRYEHFESALRGRLQNVTLELEKATHRARTAESHLMTMARMHEREERRRNLTNAVREASAMVRSAKSDLLKKQRHLHVLEGAIMQERGKQSNYINALMELNATMVVLHDFETVTIRKLHQRLLALNAKLRSTYSRLIEEADHVNNVAMYKSKLAAVAEFRDYLEKRINRTETTAANLRAQILAARRARSSIESSTANKTATTTTTTTTEHKTDAAALSSTSSSHHVAAAGTTGGGSNENNNNLLNSNSNSGQKQNEDSKMLRFLDLRAQPQPTTTVNGAKEKNRMEVVKRLSNVKLMELKEQVANMTRALVAAETHVGEVQKQLSAEERKYSLELEPLQKKIIALRNKTADIRKEKSALEVQKTQMSNDLRKTLVKLAAATKLHDRLSRHHSEVFGQTAKLIDMHKQAKEAAHVALALSKEAKVSTQRALQKAKDAYKALEIGQPNHYQMFSGEYPTSTTAAKIPDSRVDVESSQESIVENTLDSSVDLDNLARHLDQMLNKYSSLLTKHREQD
eukprot:jgi/Bigna1/137266/aug1.38_g11974